MSEDRELIESALGNLLDPVVAMLLRNGVTYREFASFSKNTFVAVAQRDFGIRGRPTNTSRVSAMTGIDRKEVKAIKDSLAADSKATEVRNSQDKMSRVIRCWHEDGDYLTSSKKPLAIPLDGETLSFKELTKRYGGGLPMNVVLKELMAADCVEAREDGLLHVLKPFYSPPSANPEALLRAGTVINDLATTLLHNLYVAPEKTRETPRFERRAMTDIAAADIKAFKTELDKEGQAFLERIAEWLIAHQIEPDDVRDKARIGVGLYGIERQPEESS